MSAQVLLADRRTISAVQRADRLPVDLTPGRRQIRFSGSGGGTAAVAAKSYLCKITSQAVAGGASYNVTVHETLAGASIGTGLLQVAEKHIAESLAVGRVVIAMPHNLQITPIVESGGV